MSHHSTWRSVVTDLLDPTRQAVAGDRRHRIVLIILTACVLAVPMTLPPGKLFNAYPGIGDDLFYYLKPALNFWQFGYPTFDGVSLTNGFHPLWMALNVLLALPFAVLGGASAFPYMSLIMNLLLVVFFGQAVFSLSRRVGFGADGSAVVSLVSVCATAEYVINGMESATVLVSLSLLFLYLVDRVDKPESVSSLSLALFSLLVLFSRLDNGIFLLLLYALLLFRLGFRKVFTAGILLTLLALPYLLTNLVTQGSFVPISKQSKDFWNSLIELDRTGAANLSIPALIHSSNFPYRVMHLWEASVRPLRVFVEMASLGVIRSLPVAPPLVKITAVSAVAVALAWWGIAGRVLRGPRTCARFLIQCFAVLAFFVVFQLCWYALTCWRFWPWYLTLDGWLTAAAFTAFLVLLLSALPTALSRSALRAYLLVFFLLAFGRAVVARSNVLQSPSYGEVYMQLAGWLRENTEPEAVCGSWAAGQVGYYADRRVVNLEGLIGDHAVLDANRRLALPEYLASKNVQYVAQHFPLDRFEFTDFLPLSTLWNLRLKPVVDHRAAVSVVRTFEGGKTQGYVLGIDTLHLHEQLRQERRTRARLSALATVVPAEDFADAAGARVRLGVVDSRAFTAVADRLVYRFERLPPGSRHVLARVLAEKPGATFRFSINGATSLAKIETPGTWTLVNCTDTPVEVVDNGAVTMIADSVSPGVHFDEFYLVAPQNRSALRSIMEKAEDDS